MTRSELIVGSASESYNEVIERVTDGEKEPVLALFLPKDSVEDQVSLDNVKVIDFSSKGIDANSMGARGVKISGKLQYHYPKGLDEDSRLGILSLDPLLEDYGLRPTIELLNLVISQFEGSGGKIVASITTEAMDEATGSSLEALFDTVEEL